MKNANEILKNVNACIAELEEANRTGGCNWDRMSYKGWTTNNKVFRIDAVYDELSIFDWWNETLSMSQLKQMQNFLTTAIKLGYTGYVCFKVGAKYCSHGMWAHKNESTDGYSPDGACLYHSFRSGDNYYDVKFDNGNWAHDLNEDKSDFTLKEVKAMLAQ